MNPEDDLCNKVLTMSLLAPGVFSSDDGQLLLISVARCWAACWQEAAAARAVSANAIVIMNAMAARAIVDEADDFVMRHEITVLAQQRLQRNGIAMVAMVVRDERKASRSARG